MNRRALMIALAGSSAAACAPMSQHAAVPGVGFAGPRLEADALIAADGTRLPMTVWLAEGAPTAIIVGLHGFADYAQSFVYAGPFWAKQGITTYAYDQRGHGRGAKDERGIWGSEALLTEDLKTMCALVRARHPGVPLAVVGESMGGSVAICAFASDTPPDADGLILASPGVWGWREQPVLNQAALWIAAHTMPGLTLTPPKWVQQTFHATDNIEAQRAMSRDANMIFGARIDTLYGIVSLMQHAEDRIGQVKVPMLYLYGAHDEVIPKKAALDAVERLPPGARTAYYAKGWHLLNRDLQRDTALLDISAFVRDPAAPLPSGAPPITADALHPVTVSGLR